jgi:RHS repeat-associated protein
VSAGPTLFTDASGAVVEERRFEPFGTPIDARKKVGSGYVVGDADFVARDLNDLNKRTDVATGWSYHGARWLAPETARWLTPDPPVKAPDPKFMEQPWALNPYQYVEQNPVAYWDPDGREPEKTEVENKTELEYEHGTKIEKTWSAQHHENEYGGWKYRDDWAKNTVSLTMTATKVSVAYSGSVYAEKLESEDWGAHVNYGNVAGGFSVDGLKGDVKAEIGASLIETGVERKAGGYVAGMDVRLGLKAGFSYKSGKVSLDIGPVTLKFGIEKKEVEQLKVEDLPEEEHEDIFSRYGDSCCSTSGTAQVEPPPPAH